MNKTRMIFLTLAIPIIFLTLTIVLFKHTLLVWAMIAIALYLYIPWAIKIGKSHYDDLKVSEYVVESDKVDCDTTVVFLSDFQFDKSENEYHQEAFQRAIDATNQIDFDLLLLGGDYVNYPKYYDKFFEDFAKIHFKVDSAFGIMGNHDYVEYEDMWNRLTKAGVTMLNNQTMTTLNNVEIVGVDDSWHGTPSLPQVSADKFNILLAHNPDFVNLIPKNNDIDIMFGGHWHGGQALFFGFPAQRLITKYVKGHHRVKGIDLFISNGLGGSFGRGEKSSYSRYHAVPEIIKVTIKKK